jgi:ribosomal protein S20
MPIIKSAIKRMRQTAVRRSRNVQTKRELRDALKAFNAAVEKAVADGKADKVMEALSHAYSKLDTAVKKNVLDKNTAARRKATLSKKAKTAGAKPTATAKKATTAKAPAKKVAPAKKAVEAEKPAKKVAEKKPAAKKPAAKKAPATKKAADKK